MKVHTTNKKKVQEILSNIRVPLNRGQMTFDFLDGETLNFKEEKNYFKLIELENDYWYDLPEFKWSEFMEKRAVFDVKLNTPEERKAFFEGFGVKPTDLGYIHYELEQNPMEDYEYTFTEHIDNRYPIYVITKGRPNKIYTIETLEEMGLDYYLCVEPSEYEQYIANPKVIKEKILICPEDFSKRGQGAVPVRNFVWEHASQNGHQKHWQLDDNIHWMFRWNNNLQKKITDGVFFRVMEDFSDRYTNMGLVSPQIQSFAPHIKTHYQPVIFNTRAYCCILINNELLDQRLEERWRGRYNDDTDLSLRVLSTGDICTANFYAFLSGKLTSGRTKGGMADMYKNHSHEGYWKKFEALRNTWGNLITFTNKRHADGRPHHHIEYTKHFKQKPILKEGVEFKQKINEYNMVFSKP